MFDVALKLFLVIGTLFYLPVGMENPALALEKGYMHQELFFRYGVMFLFALSFTTPRRREVQPSTSRLLSLFFLYVIVISAFTNFDLQSRRAILNVGTSLLFLKMIVEHFDFDLKSVGTWLFWLMVANLVLCWFQIYATDPLYDHIWFKGQWRDGVGFMRLKATLGCLAAVVAPLLFFISPLLVLVTLPLLWYAQSSVAMGAFVVSMGFLLYFRLPKWVWWGILAVLVVGGGSYVVLYDMPRGQFGTRFEVWWETFSHALKYSPFFGLGIGKFAAFEPMTSQGPENPQMLSWIWTHNEYLQAFFELGAVGLAFIFAFVKNQVDGFKKMLFDLEAQALFASFMVILMISVFHFPFHVARMAIPCLVVMGLLMCKLSKVRDEETSDSNSDYMFGF